MLGIPFYVWDFADRFKEDVIDDFVESYARGETPNPCVRCNERIKFSALSARALALGFDAVATGHYARLSRRAAASRGGPRQGPVLRAGRADRRTAASCRVPDRRHAQAGDPRGSRPSAAWPSPTSRTVTTSASSRPVTPRPSSAPGSACGAERSSTPVVRCSPNTTACTGSPSVSARASASPDPGADGLPRYVTAIDAETGTVRVGSAADLDVCDLTAQRPVFTSGTPVRGARRVRGAGARARRDRCRRRRTGRR